MIFEVFMVLMIMLTNAWPTIIFFNVISKQNIRGPLPLFAPFHFSTIVIAFVCVCVGVMVVVSGNVVLVWSWL